MKSLIIGADEVDSATFSDISSVRFSELVIGVLQVHLKKKVFLPYEKIEITYDTVIPGLLKREPKITLINATTNIETDFGTVSEKKCLSFTLHQCGTYWIKVGKKSCVSIFKVEGVRFYIFIIS